MAVVTCSSCKVRISVKDEMLGKRVKCPKCATLIVLEAGPGTPPSPWKKVSPVAPVSQKPIAPAAPSLPPPLPPPAPMPAPITRTPPKRKASPSLDELEEEVDEPLPPTAKRRAPARYEDDDDDIEDAEPDDDRPRRRSRRDDDDEDDDERPRSKRSIKWQTARTGMHIALASVALMLVSVLVSAVINIAAPSAVRAPFNRPGGFQTLGALGVISGTLSLVAVICHFIAMCMSISAPSRMAESRARKAMIFFVVAFVVSILSVCIMFTIMMVTANAARNNINNPQQFDNFFASMGAMAIVGMLLFLVVAGFGIASGVCWMLYHASVADAFRKPDLRGHAIMLLVAGIVVPFLVAGLGVAIQVVMLRPDGMPGAGMIIHALLNVIVYGGLGGWYIYLNRSLARLM